MDKFILKFFGDVEFQFSSNMNLAVPRESEVVLFDNKVFTVKAVSWEFSNNGVVVSIFLENDITR